MKKTFLIFIAMLTSINGIAAQKSFPPKEKQAILIIKQESWQIKEKDVKKALKAIGIFLRNEKAHENIGKYEKIQIKYISDNFNTYNVQFIPRTINGSKIIYCNFFKPASIYPNWKTEETLVIDGGNSFWQIEYNIETGKCSNFNVNSTG